ncbi:MAG: type 4a pilus biogenesis protein PilO [Planctomycetota bacterium]|nr:type 4a pilus biogenesis protein PilO [Planctomycetota bacterium]
MIDTAGVAAVIGLSLGAYLLDIHPLQRARAESAAQAAELAGQHRKADDLAAKLHKLQDRLQETRGKAEAGSLRLEPAQNLNQRLARLTDLATANHLRIDAVEPGKPLPGPQCDVVEIRVACLGSFRGCSEFLDRLHHEMPDAAVVSLEIAGRPGAAEAPANLTFTLYWFAAKAEPAGK